MTPSHRPLVVFDVETTGVKPEEGHSIVEIAAERIEARSVVATFHTLVNPGHGIGDEAVRIHGITDREIFRLGRKPEEALPAFLSFAGDAILVGHNVQFDIGFVNEHLRRLQLAPLANDALDTVELARRYLILPSYNLVSVAAYLKIAHPNAHRAAADVATTRAVLFCLLDRAQQRVRS